MITCDRCVFWQKDDIEGWFVIVRHRPCVNPNWVLQHDKKPIPEDGVLLEDDAGWGFRTAPKFGCIHAKEGQ